ncbi:uncharacterized protein B0I36DRAFT_83191 [Microdochium trichocladiopsis]|uniref:Uncharacterized protein n=1 Tax=Microdochium trichocladiopsis TaxID=1682393 RepID=A0A9P9BQA9_9PEZI|nr:uncharacterized protein B0I36DRAFT_83191 [Microdochium trichocladiopsis]KAH7034693.1 hypothetical protein B0I36DRAFT_83191 [Microdochium trichocladiopsis]
MSASTRPGSAIHPQQQRLKSTELSRVKNRPSPISLIPDQTSSPSTMPPPGALTPHLLSSLTAPKTQGEPYPCSQLFLVLISMLQCVSML